MKLIDELYAIALYTYPAEFRARFGREMQQVFRTRRASASSLPRFLLATAGDLIVTSIKERSVIMNVQQLVFRIAFGVVLFLGVSASMLQAFYVPTGSMEPSLQIGDHLLVNKIGHDPQHGEIVVFRYPDDPSQTFIKRVIGLPGDRIRIENKQVIRNGERLVEAYARNLTYVDSYRDNFPGAPNVHVEKLASEMLSRNVENGEVVVPEGALFVLGDNRDRSLDSRFFGFVPQSNVIGRPWMVYWSSGNWDRTLLQVH
jgi:signal peptidase I